MTVPKNALRGLVQLVIEPADPIQHPGSKAVGNAFRIRMDPDPGRLDKPIKMRSLVQAPPFRSPSDFVLLREYEWFDWKHRTLGKSLSAARTDEGLSSDRRFFSATSRRPGHFQVFVSRSPRAIEDAALLLTKGIEELKTFNTRAFERTRRFCKEALQADPYQDEARFYWAIARLALLLDDRSDTTAGIDSFGELLAGYGLRLGSKNMLARIWSEEWPIFGGIPQNAPGQAAMLGFYGVSLRPQLLTIRDELLKVSDDFDSKLTPPDFLRTGKQLQRELDFGDLALK
ncbi:MAG: hypothetical protein CSA62_12600 [Planctomycetota bacterium]|nr:MAG: hypothetical protein CSA62_12600 [Planctomycetota bacterium]